jgi:hypothetical protein
MIGDANAQRHAGWRGRARSRGLLGALSACVALLGVACSPVATSAASFRFGLSDYAPATFSDPRVAQLGVQLARDVVPWNAAVVPRDRAAVTAWLGAVKLAGITPLITFQHADNNGRAPTKAQFLTDFLRFRRLFGWVTEFCPWDEATHAGQPTARRPRLAADYYNAIAAHCPHCEVTAPDTLDADGNIEGWIRAFLKTAHPYPKIWPFNPYRSASNDDRSPVERLLRSVRGRIWFSEVGGVVWWRFQGRLIYHGVAYAARVAKNIFKLAALSPRVTRIYYYHWRSPGNPRTLSRRSTWDAGLVGSDNAARPALLVVARSLHRHVQSATPRS